MSRRKLKDRNTRKLFTRGSSTAITLPIEIVRKLKLRKKTENDSPPERENNHDHRLEKIVKID